MGNLGTGELLLIVFAIVLIFGVGRISKIGRELGTGIREFREGLSGDKEEEEKQETNEETA